jgi:hypothetical protein
MVSVTSGFGNQANGLLWNAKSSVANPQTSSGDLPANSNTNPVVTVLLSGVASPDNPLTKPLSDEQRQARDAIRTLNQVQKQLVDDRKSSALQKLDRLREQLRILRSLGGDPKTIARQAKQIAQEIGAAATEYAAAVASEGGADASAPADPSSTASAGSDSGSSASGAEATAGSTPEAATSPEAATGQDTQAVTGVATEATATGEKSSAASPSKDSKADSDASRTAGAATDTDAARQKTLKVYQDAAAKTAANSAQASGDRDALQQFKDAARDAKNLIEEAARKLRAKRSADPDAADAERAVSGLDHDIADLSDAIQSQQIETAGVDTGAAIPDASASVAINILA